jgi:hypothetical protein
MPNNSAHVLIVASFLLLLLLLLHTPPSPVARWIDRRNLQQGDNSEFASASNLGFSAHAASSSPSNLENGLSGYVTGYDPGTKLPKVNVGENC